MSATNIYNPEAAPTVLVDRSGKHDDECPICYTEYEGTEKLLQETTCKHTFCPECFFLFAETSTKCPMCRQPCYTPANIVAQVKEEPQRTKHTQKIEKCLDDIHQILDDIEQKLNSDQPKAEASRTTYSYVPPYAELRKTLTSSRQRLQTRLTRWTPENRPTNVLKLKRLSKDLKDARTAVQAVLNELTSKQGPRRDIQQHFLLASFKL